MEQLDIFFYSISSLSFSFGIPLNAFIFIVSIRAWDKDGHQRPVDLILSTMGVINIISQSSQFFGDILYIFFKDIFSPLGRYFHCVLNCGSLLCGSWVTAWLCIFYCIRIITFQHRLVTYLKLRFHKLLPRLLSGCIVLSYSLGTLMMVILVRYFPFASKTNKTEFVNVEQISAVRNTNLFMQWMTIVTCVPSLLTLTSLSFTITSLSSHVLKLHRGTSSIGFSQLKAHVNVVITMTVLLVLEVFYYIAHLSVHLQESSYGSIWSMVCYVIYYCDSILQALILILGNQKLRLACWFSSCSKGEEGVQVNT